jgi:predicted ATP-dependent endonuclease of OLD family
MIIKSLSIQNIRSIGEKITINFEDGINILIGPNGGGKSNILDILNFVINKYFIHHWNEENRQEGRLTYLKGDIGNIKEFSKHNDIQDKIDQEIEITVFITDNDIENIKILKENLEKISETESKLTNKTDIKDNFQPFFEDIDIVNFYKKNREHNFLIKNNSLPRNLHTKEWRLLILFMNYFEKIRDIIDRYNEGKDDNDKIPSLKYLWKYFSPNRFCYGQNLSANLSTLDKTKMFCGAKTKTSKKQPSSDINYAVLYFAWKFNRLHRNDNDFARDEQVIQVKELLKKLGGYDFLIKTINLENNTYKIIVKVEGKKIEFNDLSSGETEILNFIFSIVAFDLKDAVIVVDEPELHLHPQWQNKLIDLYHYCPVKQI